MLPQPVEIGENQRRLELLETVPSDFGNATEEVVSSLTGDVKSAVDPNDPRQEELAQKAIEKAEKEKRYAFARVILLEVIGKYPGLEVNSMAILGKATSFREGEEKSSVFMDNFKKVIVDMIKSGLSPSQIERKKDKNQPKNEVRLPRAGVVSVEGRNDFIRGTNMTVTEYVDEAYKKVLWACEEYGKAYNAMIEGTS